MVVPREEQGAKRTGGVSDARAQNRTRPALQGPGQVSWRETQATIRPAPWALGAGDLENLPLGGRSRMVSSLGPEKQHHPSREINAVHLNFIVL